MCIVFKSVYIHFFLFVQDSFLCSIWKYMYDEERLMCKDMVHMLIMVCLADSNSTVLHFDSLNKPDLNSCGPVAVQSLAQSLSKIQWDPLFRLFACYYALCFLRNQHTYPKSFTIVWSSILTQNILTIHFFVLMNYNFHSFTWHVDIVTLLFMHQVYFVNQNAGLCY